MPSARDQSRGIVAMNISMFFFVASDALIKWVSGVLPLGEAIFLRGVGATVLLAAAVAWTGSWRSWRQLADVKMALRLIGEVGSTLFYLVALVHMPIANASAVFQVTPLAMTAGAAIFLGERVGPWRWSAIAVGFVGVTIIIRPGLDGFDAWSIAVLIGISFVTLRDLATARMPATVPTTLILSMTALSATVLGLAMMPFEKYVSLNAVWMVPEPKILALVGLNAFTLIGGYAGLLIATRLAETSAIAPFRYALLIWAFLLGIVVFGQYPDVPTLVGTAIVVATGLFAYWRERSLSSSRRATAVEPVERDERRRA